MEAFSSWLFFYFFVELYVSGSQNVDCNSLNPPKLQSLKHPFSVLITKRSYGFSKNMHKGTRDYIFSCGQGMIVVLRTYIWQSSPRHQSNASHLYSRQLNTRDSGESSLGLCDKTLWGWLDCFPFAKCSFALILRKVLALFDYKVLHKSSGEVSRGPCMLDLS